MTSIIEIQNKELKLHYFVSFKLGEYLIYATKHRFNCCVKLLPNHGKIFQFISNVISLTREHSSEVNKDLLNYAVQKFYNDIRPLVTQACTSPTRTDPSSTGEVASQMVSLKRCCLANAEFTKCLYKQEWFQLILDIVGKQWFPSLEISRLFLIE